MLNTGKTQLSFLLIHVWSSSSSTPTACPRMPNSWFFASQKLRWSQYQNTSFHFRFRDRAVKTPSESQEDQVSLSSSPPSGGNNPDNVETLLNHPEMRVITCPSSSPIFTVLLSYYFLPQNTFDGCCLVQEPWLYLLYKPSYSKLKIFYKYWEWVTVIM